MSELDAEPQLFYWSGDVIDGLAVDDVENLLFLTAISDASGGDGHIACMSINDNTTYQQVITGLNKPRAIRVDSTNR